MKAKELAVLAAAALALAPLAVAAQQGISHYKEADDDMRIEAFDRSVDDIEDMELKTADGDDMGEIEEVLLDADGRPVALAVEVGGREVVLDLDEVRLEDDDLVTSANKAALKRLPEWRD